MTLLLADITLRTAVKYVGAAYAVVWLATLVYVWLLTSKLRRMERQLEEAERRLAAREAEPRVERVGV